MINSFKNNPFVRKGEELLTEDQLVTSLSRIDQRLHESKHTAKFAFWKYCGIAATILLLVICATVYFALSPNPIDQAAAKLMDTTPFSTTMTANDLPADLSVLKKEAVALYRSENYHEALAVFTELEALEPNEPLYKVFVGDIFLKQGQLEPAEKYLRIALANFETLGNKDWVYATRFQLAVTLAQNGQLTEARDLLEKTIDLKGGLETEATKILEAL